MHRRHFIKLCGSALTAVTANSLLAGAADALLHSYNRVRLVDKGGKPLAVRKLKKNEQYLFHYPYAGTPAFLLRLPQASKGGETLKTAAGKEYVWKGGVGPDRSVVAFSAICAHQLSYPSRTQSFINYIPNKSPVAGRGNVIVCCAHHSVYDPAHGARVLAGPSPQPLLAILLEYEAATDGLYATGTCGSPMFDEFFKAYKRELIEEFGRGVSRQQVEKTAIVMPLAEYVSQAILC